MILQKAGMNNTHHPGAKATSPGQPSSTTSRCIGCATPGGKCLTRIKEREQLYSCAGTARIWQKPQPLPSGRTAEGASPPSCWLLLSPIPCHNTRLHRISPQGEIKQNRVGDGITPVVLSHHRTYGSVYGGSLNTLEAPQGIQQ